MKRRSLNKLYSIKFKNQKLKIQLKTLKLSSCHPERSEGPLRRMSND